MSLLERAQNNNSENSSSTSLIRMQENNAEKSKNDLTDLRNQVQEIVSADKLADFVALNPRKAQAEIRSAAKYCFGKSRWDLYSDQDKEDLLHDLLDFMFGFGPIESLLENPQITEVMVNGTDSIYYEKDGKLYRSKQCFNTEDQVRALIDRILGPLGRRIDESSPTVNARLNVGHRVHAVIPPLSLVGPVLTIRKFSEHVITLDEMVKLNSFDKRMQTFLQWAVLMRKNIAVSGGTGSGKTTLLNALSCEILHSERILTIEDSAELRFLEHPHVVRLEARPKNAEGMGEVTIRDLVINALRMRPDRIVVGECRGAEALDMLQAMNTGHDGSLTTLHANSPTESISRLTTMVRYAVDLPVDVIEAYIATALNLVVQTARGVDGSRYVSDVVAFSYSQEKRKCEISPIFRRGPFDRVGKWLSIPDWIDDVSSYKHATKGEVEQWKLSVG